MLHLIVKVPIYNVRTYYMTSNYNVRIYVQVLIMSTLLDIISIGTHILYQILQIGCGYIKFK